MKKRAKDIMKNFKEAYKNFKKFCIDNDKYFYEGLTEAMLNYMRKK